MSVVEAKKQSDLDQRFVEAMREVVAERGRHWVYPDVDLDVEARVERNPDWYTDEGECLYFGADDQPRCIVGAAIAAMGETPLQIPGLCASNYLVGHYGIGPRVASAADRAQALQDCGSTWGAALRAFEEKLENSKVFDE